MKSKAAWTAIVLVVVFCVLAWAAPPRKMKRGDHWINVPVTLTTDEGTTIRGTIIRSSVKGTAQTGWSGEWLRARTDAGMEVAIAWDNIRRVDFSENGIRYTVTKADDSKPEYVFLNQSTSQPAAEVSVTVCEPDGTFVTIGSAELKSVTINGLDTDGLGYPMQAGWKYSPWTGEEL